MEQCAMAVYGKQNSGQSGHSADYHEHVPEI